MDHKVERRDDARIVRNKQAEIKSIQTLLDDVYKDEGDGRTLLRELIQNADDACAERLILVILESGSTDACNSLLRGPGILVANDGPFTVTNQEGLHNSIGGDKAADPEKIGRFGLGLKSAFHVCEALVYLGAENGTLRPGALNPWAGTGGDDRADPLHPDWDTVVADDLEQLLGVANLILGSFENGLLLWIPLRRNVQLDRAEEEEYGLGRFCPSTNEVTKWLSQTASMTLLLAQCGSLRVIETGSADSAQMLSSRQRLVCVSRPNDSRWVGRYKEDTPELNRTFEGTVENDSIRTNVVGCEVLKPETLARERGHGSWPSDPPQWKDGRKCRPILKKALAHAAISILRPENVSSEFSGGHIRWAVYLPLDDNPTPRDNSTVETLGDASADGAWEIVLHGYFWPSQDRRSIPGVTNDDMGTGDSEVRLRWNRVVRDELLLPLFPAALSLAVKGLPVHVARTLIARVASSRLVNSNLVAITRLQLLLPVLAEDGVRWITAGIDESVLSLSQWTQAPSGVRNAFLTEISQRNQEFVFIDADSPRIGGSTDDWPESWLGSLLRCVAGKDLQAVRTLCWVSGLLCHILGNEVSRDDERAAVVARWLAEKIAEGALAPTTVATAERDQLRTAWRELFERLPQDWLLNVPLECQPAVLELAAERIVGERFVPVPLGRRTGHLGPSCLDPVRLDSALLYLGQRLQTTDGVSQRAQQARILLAEKLLSVRGPRPLGDGLASLPLLRARRLPADKDEAWSVGDLQQAASRQRVFTRPSFVEEGGGSSEFAADSKQAATELAQAIGDTVWLVDTAVASMAEIPGVTPEALSVAVLRATTIASDTKQRIPLLKRLADSATSADVRGAVRLLLTGRRTAVGEDCDLFYVRSQDSNRDANRKSLELLLRLQNRTECAVESVLVEPLPHLLVQDLHIKAVDNGVLHQLLSGAVEGTAEWTSLERRDALHLLRQLFSTTDRERARWRRMPLHRRLDGTRGLVDDRTLRAKGEVTLPADLEAEVQLLAPDEEVSDLYQDVPELDNSGLLREMLASQMPRRFATQILQLLRSEDGSEVLLPSDKKLREQLKNSAWIPEVGQVAGVAPHYVLMVPAELQKALRPLAASGVLGNYRLPAAIESSVWANAKAVVVELLGRPSRAEQVRRAAIAIDGSYLPKANGGEYVILSEPGRVEITVLDDALQTPLPGSHLGWGIVKAAANAVGATGQSLAEATGSASDSVLAIGRALCGPVTTTVQVKMLKAVAATRPSRDAPGGRFFRVLLEAFSHGARFLEEVLPQITLPTQAGQWSDPREIACSESGVARRHRVAADLRTCLRLDSNEPIRQGAQHQTTRPTAVDTSRALATYFEPWAGKVPAGAVGGFLSLLGEGRNGAILTLARSWLGDDVSVEGMHRELFGDADALRGIRVFFSGRVARGQRSEVLNLLGERVEMEADSDDATIFAADPERLNHWCGDFWSPHLGDVEVGSSRHAQGSPFLPFWSLNLRDVEPPKRTARELLQMLSDAVQWWAVRILQLDRTRVDEWCSRWGTGSQAQVGPVQASILANLPRTLRDLNVRDCEPLRDALRNAERAQRRREQIQSREAVDAERRALDELAGLIRTESAHQRFLWERVQNLMHRYGYRGDSVLLELVQNADDALAQAAEISPGALPAAVRQLVIRIHQVSGVPTVDVTHFGRPINDTGGAAFPAGRDREWDQDLYFMMLLNLSGKPGEAPGVAATTSTTGRFGLGFKSVHLVTESPFIVSGFLAFSIVGGLLPLERPIPDEPDLAPVAGHRVTRVRLPLRDDREAPGLIQEMFRRFHYTRALLPVFSRQLREIVVDGGPFAGISTFDGVPVCGAPGWCVAADATEIPGEGQWRILRFRPADAGEATGTAAIAVGLFETMPTEFPAKLPYLWNVTPTSEGWGCGYAVNGPFKLDPGRTHVSLDDEATLRVVELLGVALGRGLIHLHDSLIGMTDSEECGLPSGEQAKHFLASLWTILTTGLDSSDELRRGFLLRLHGAGRGLSAWMNARAVVPTGLPALFKGWLPPVTSETIIEEAASGLENDELCTALGQIADVATLARSHRVVSRDIARRLRPLVHTVISELRPTDILSELTTNWNQSLTPQRLRELRSLACVWHLLQDSQTAASWYSQFVARSQGGKHQLLRHLLLPKDLAVTTVDTDVQEELLRSAFAPDASILHQEYIEHLEDLTMFLRLRVRHEVDAATMTAWCVNLSAPRRNAALRYLLRGRLQQEMLQRLVGDRPQWLNDYDAVRKLLDELGDEEWRCRQLLAALFPERFSTARESTQDQTLPESVTRTFFQRLQEWWHDVNERSRVINWYEERTWPEWLRREGIAERLQSDSDDHWLGLLVLGACHSLGRAHEGHHRGFVEWAHEQGLWEVFRTPQTPQLWMQRLRDWQDNSVANLEYARWMSLFPAIYQLSRYLEKYRRLLRTAGRRTVDLYRVTCLLAPKVDEALTFAGQQFDAPPAPLNMGLHWVLRELVRLQVVEGEHVYQDCWVPSEQVLEFLRPFGLRLPDGSSSNVEKARAVSAFFASHLATPTPHLHRAFDIPIRYLANNSEQRKHFGLEQP